MKPEKIIREFSSQLLGKQNVVSVGWGIKRVNGKFTDKPAIIVGVRQKQPIGELTIQDVIPAQIQGIDTDVIEVGEIKALGVKNGQEK